MIKELSELLSTNERIKTLNTIIYNEDGFSQIEIIKKSKFSKGFISQYFSILKKSNIIKEKENKYFVKHNNFNTKMIRIILNLNQIKPQIFKKHDFIISVGLYGSYVKGENTINSDMDIWILTKNINNKIKIELNTILKQKYENISILYLNEKKLENLKKKDTIFYYSLVFSSIILYGEKLENV